MAQPALDPPTSTSAQLVVLRVVIVSSVMDAILMAIYFGGDLLTPCRSWLYLAPVLVVVCHHVGSAFGPTLFPVKRWIDIALTLLEVVFAWFATGAYMWYFYSDSAPEAIIGSISHWAVSLSLTLLLVLRVNGWWKSSGPRWSATLDVVQVPQDHWWQYPVTTIFGQKLWRSAMPGEAGWISIARGIAALLTVTAMVAFAAYEIVLSPLAEMGKVSQRQHRIPRSSANTLFDTKGRRGEWTIVLMWDDHLQRNSETIAEAINVGWSFGTIEGGTICEAIPSTYSACGPMGCYQASPDWKHGGQEQKTVPILHMVDIHIDFAKLFSPYGTRQNLTGWLNSGARVYVGKKSSLDPEGSTIGKPIYLFPVAHQRRIATPVIQRHIKTPSLAAMGFAPHSESIVLNPLQAMPSPSANSSDPNITTLTVAIDNSDDKLTVNEEFSDKSVLTGFSAVGGLASFLSTVFIILMGTSLMRATTRIKDQSPLGLLHTGMNDKLIQACRDKYPELEADIKRFRQDSGLVVYLFDTLAAMGPLEHLERDKQRPAEPDPATSLEDDIESKAT